LYKHLEINIKKFENNFPNLENINLVNIMKSADLLIIDYLTTSTAKLSVTNLPIIFFDLGLRNIVNIAMDKIKERFIYIPVSNKNFSINKKIFIEECSKSKNYNYVRNYALNNNFYDEEKRISDIVSGNFFK